MNSTSSLKLQTLTTEFPTLDPTLASTARCSGSLLPLLSRHVNVKVNRSASGLGFQAWGPGFQTSLSNLNPEILRSPRMLSHIAHLAAFFWWRAVDLVTFFPGCGPITPLAGASVSMGTHVYGSDLNPTTRTSRISALQGTRPCWTPGSFALLNSEADTFITWP